MDLVKEMSGQRKVNKIVAVMSSQDDEAAALVDYTVVYGLDAANENVLLGLDYILFAQTLAVLKSCLWISHPIIRVRQEKSTEWSRV